MELTVNVVAARTSATRVAETAAEDVNAPCSEPALTIRVTPEPTVSAAAEAVIEAVWIVRVLEPTLVTLTVPAHDNRGRLNG